MQANNLITEVKINVVLCFAARITYGLSNTARWQEAW
jgi:hypothetical protein